MSKNTMNILKKELRRTFRDKKSLAMMLLVPILIPVIVFGFCAMFQAQANESDGRYNKIGFAYELSEDEMEIAKVVDIDVIAGDKDELAQKYKKGEIDLYITKEDEKFIINSNNSNSSMYAENIVSIYFEAYKTYLQSKMLDYTTLDQQEFFNIVQIDKKVVEEENFIVNYIKSYVFLFCMMAVVFAAIYPATDTTAGEKERGTLETLLTFPIKAKDIIVGKFLCVSLSSMITGLISFILGIISVNIAKGKFEIFDGIASVNYNTASIIFGSLIICVYAILVSGLCILLAGKAKSFKEAQSALTPISFLAIIPGMVAMIAQLKTTLVYSIIPFLNYSLIFDDISKGNINMLHVITMTASSVIYIIVMLTVLIKQYKSEKVLFS